MTKIVDKLNLFMYLFIFRLYSVKQSNTQQLSFSIIDVMSWEGTNDWKDLGMDPWNAFL